jgi:hypothetical protein
MAFPVSPTDGQTYTNNGVSYTYSAGLGVWNITGSVPIGSPVTSVAGRQGAVTLGASDIASGTYATGDRTAVGNFFVTSGNIVAASGTASSSTTTGALVVVGGAGISGAATIGGTLNVTGATTLSSLSVSGTSTLSGGLTLGTLTLNNATGAQLSLTGSTSSWINIGGTTGVAAPTFTTRSAGSKLVLYENIGAASAGYAIGIEGSTMWFSTDTTSSGYKWYGGTTAHTTLSGAGALVLSSTCQTTSLGVGTAASGTSGQILATNSITAYYSDLRLKTEVKRIDNALAKVRRLSGIYFVNNDVAEKYGYTDKERQVGFIVQEWERELPEVVQPAPFDTAFDENGKSYSKSGENYKTMHYEKAGPLLLEAIKDLADEVDAIKKHLGM